MVFQARPRHLTIGIVYGIKIRFPHALIMTFLFRSGTYSPDYPASLTGQTSAEILGNI
jgi:hypothetical protein